MPVSAASSCRSPQAFFMHFFMIHLRPVERPGVVSWSPRKKINCISERRARGHCLRHFVLIPWEPKAYQRNRFEVKYCFVFWVLAREQNRSPRPVRSSVGTNAGVATGKRQCQCVRRESSTSKSYYQVSAAFFDQHERKHQRKKENSWCLTLTANCNIIAQEGLAGVVTGVCSG